MDESSPIPKPNAMRLTTKAGLGLAGLLIAMPQLKAIKEFIMGDQIVTNERIEKNVSDGFSRLEAKIDRNFESERTVHQRIRDLDREDLSASEARCEKRSDKVEARVSNLESYAFKNLRAKGSQN